MRLVAGFWRPIWFGRRGSKWLDRMNPNGQTAPDTSREQSIRQSFFDTSQLSGDLKRRAVRGGTITMVGQVAGQVAQIGGTRVLARVLRPTDFGLLVMISAVTGLVSIFVNSGLVMPTIQREKISHEQISTLFWVNLAVGIVCMLAIMALAPGLAWFYGEDELLWLTIVMSISLVFAGASVQHNALLRRQMRFGALAGLSIGRPAISALVGIVAALAGAGVWALVYMTLAGSIFGALWVWLCCPWRPGPPKRGAGVGSMFGFGANVTGHDLVNYLARNLDNVLIGKFCGAVQVALYNRAYALLLLPISQISTPVTTAAIPVLSRLQNEPQKYRAYYLKAVRLIASITMPAACLMIVMSKDIILGVLGEQWIGASNIFAILGLSAAIQPVLHTQGWLYISSGHAKQMFRWSICTSIVTGTSFVIGLPFGAIGVATAYTICVLLLAIPSLWNACRGTPVRVADVAEAVWVPAAATLIAVAALLWFKICFAEVMAGISGLALALTGVLAVFLGVSCVLTRSLQPIFQWIDLFRSR